MQTERDCKSAIEFGLEWPGLGGVHKERRRKTEELEKR